MGEKTYEDLKKKLMEVPGAVEFMSRERVGLAKRVLSLRKQLDWTFLELLSHLEESGSAITAEVLYNIEWGIEDIALEDYHEVITYMERVVSEESE